MLPPRDYLHSLIISDVFTRSETAEIINIEGSPSPWLFDFKKVLLTASFLRAYADEFWTRYQPQYPFQVGGLENGALPLITAIVLAGERRGCAVNGFFIRKSRKKTGIMNLIEGRLNQQPIILVDDIIHSGRSFFEQISVLDKLCIDHEPVGTVKEVFAILRFRDRSEYQWLLNRGVQVTSLFELNDFKTSLGVNNQTKDRPEVPAGGTILWRVRSGTSALAAVLPKSELLVKDGRVYFSTDEGYLLCLDQTNGNELWRYRVPFGKTGRVSFSSPVSCAGSLVFGSKDGNVYALDEQTGKRRWTYLEADWLQGSPGVSNELGWVFVSLSFGLFKKQGRVVALEAKSGEKKWEFTVESPLGGGISYSAKLKSIFFGAEDGTFYALQASSGELIWQTDLPLKVRGYPTIDEGSQTVFVGGLPGLGELASDQGVFYALDVKTGHQKFVFRDFLFGTYSTPTVIDNRVYITALDKSLYCLDKDTGRRLWAVDLGARCFASVTRLETKEGLPVIGVGANNGRWQIFSATDGCQLGSLYLTERIVNRAYFDRFSRVVYVATQANELYAIEVTI